MENKELYEKVVKMNELNAKLKCLFCSLLVVSLTMIIYVTGDKSLMWWYLAPVLCYAGSK